MKKMPQTEALGEIENTILITEDEIMKAVDQFNND
jgi:hypothetical protein